MFDQVVAALAEGQGTTDPAEVWKAIDINEAHRIGFVQTCRLRYTRGMRDCIGAAKTMTAFSACDLPRPDPADLALAATPEPLACDRKGKIDGPAYVTTDQFIARHGAGATALSALSTSKAQPLEVCGYAPSMFAVAELACDDGSHPLGTTDGDLSTLVGAVQRVRHNVGPGGRCNSIIDEYAIPCPEATYHVFVDLYICLPGAWRSES